jgi:hypothetical protein
MEEKSIFCPWLVEYLLLVMSWWLPSYLTKRIPAGRWDNDEFNEFDKYLLFGDVYVEWKAFNHPQFGDIEIEA